MFGDFSCTATYCELCTICMLLSTPAERLKAKWSGGGVARGGGAGDDGAGDDGAGGGAGGGCAGRAEWRRVAVAEEAVLLRVAPVLLGTSTSRTSSMHAAHAPDASACFTSAGASSCLLQRQGGRNWRADTQRGYVRGGGGGGAWGARVDGGGGRGLCGGGGAAREEIHEEREKWLVCNSTLAAVVVAVVVVGGGCVTPPW